MANGSLGAGLYFSILSSRSLKNTGRTLFMNFGAIICLTNCSAYG